MAKRDIKVNYDDLGDRLSQIRIYRSALETMRTAVKDTNDLICASNEAETIEKLEKRYKKAKKRMDDCYDELDALYGLIDGYITEMTAIIEPKKGLTRVGRNDIYWNLYAVKSAIDSMLDLQGSCTLWPSAGIGKTEEEKQAMERNYDRITNTVWGSICQTLNGELESAKKKLQKYYDNEITDYENKDDDYKKKAKKVRDEYSSFWEKFKQNTIDNATSFWKVIKGAVMAVVDLLKGLYSIGNMIYYYNSGKIAAIVMLVSPDPPKWAETDFNESKNYFGNITSAIQHPLRTLESMAQGYNDTYEEEGLEYMGGYVIGDVLAGEAMAAGVSKVIGKGAGVVDDIGELASKTDDVADVAEAAGKLDDALDNLESFYDDVYDPYYGKQFDPLEEGAILDPDEVADIAETASKSGSKTLQTGGRQIDYNAYIKRLETIDTEYENIRIDTTDIQKNSQNTGMPEWKINRIKEHLFCNEHILDSGVKRFDADPEIADAWHRLTNGTYNQNDIDLLNHEYFESKFESFYKTDYRTAHNKTEESGRIWDPYKEE